MDHPTTPTEGDSTDNDNNNVIHHQSENSSHCQNSTNHSTSTLPDKNENYNNVTYWNQRYSHEDSYEWCKDYNSIKSHIEKCIKPTDRILIIGCGNSNFSIDLYNDGYHDITNIDYSTVIIDKLQIKYGHLMKYFVMDMREFHFDEPFDVVIEKSTLDVLFTAETSSWNISQETTQDVEKTLTCIKNAMKISSNSDVNSSSKFISITFAEPYFRKKFYSKYWNNISVESFGDFFHYYFYVMH